MTTLPPLTNPADRPAEGDPDTNLATPGTRDLTDGSPPVSTPAEDKARANAPIAAPGKPTLDEQRQDTDYDPAGARKQRADKEDSQIHPHTRPVEPS